MDQQRNSRSKDTVKLLCGEEYREVPAFEWRNKLCKGKVLIGRMMHLCKLKPGVKSVSKETASAIVAGEVVDDWISKNVYPTDERSVASTILNEYELFRELCKISCRSDRPVPQNWTVRVQNFNEKMTKNAYDIRAKTANFMKSSELLHGVKMTKADDEFWYDNCHGKYVAFCTTSVPRNWIKQQRRKREREAATEKKTGIREEEVREIDSECDDFVTSDNDKDDDFVVKDVISSQICDRMVTERETSAFPKVAIRESRKNISEAIMRCLIQCLSKYKVTTNDLTCIVRDVANVIFGQNWSYSATDETECDYSSDSDSECDADMNNNSTKNRKRKKTNKDMTYVLPSRRTIAAYLQDASMLNLKMVAETLTKRNEEDVITVGLDDTTKAAGHRVFSVKTDHITVTSSDSKHTFTTGFVENASHEGKAGAEAYLMKLQSLAILADTTVEDIKESIDFWMTDRAGDCSTMLKELNITDEKILKCTAHILLCIDCAIDKTFKCAEQVIGLEKLIDGGKILKNVSNSVHTTGLIALAKLLSPSHSANSVSLYADFQDWLTGDRAKFHGFVSNRFGRILELAQEFLTHKESILEYFEKTVDENANKLVLAVKCFIDNNWFQVCCEVYSVLGQLIINPLMELLGIDKRGSGKEKCDWSKLKEFFNTKLERLGVLNKDFSKTETGKGRLIGACLAEIMEAVRHQLGAMPYFTDSEDVQYDEKKMAQAPVMNLGCESRFAGLDNRVRVAGGMTTVNTHSMKAIVAGNGLLERDSFLELSEVERVRQWKWGRTSKEVQEVKVLEKDFLAKVKAMKVMSRIEREKTKRKRVVRMLRLLESCKTHGGPITPSNLELLKRLNQKQLIQEICYLRITACPDIKQKRKIKTPDGKYRFQIFSLSELRKSIEQAIQPGGMNTENVDELLKMAFS